MPRLLALVLVIAAGLCCTSAQAQVHTGGGFGSHGGGFGIGNSRISINFRSSTGPFRHQFFPQSFFVGEPWFADYSPVSQNPQLIIIQQPAVSTLRPRDEAKPITPLMIELRGDRYVRVGQAGGAARGRAANLTQFRTEPAQRGELKASAAELPPAILLFRNGHREEVASYAISGGVMYINANYWTSGAWTRKIQVADLDLPSTLKVNQERGVKFVLPAGPNEVVTRP